jgi:hypothetical protein
VVFLERSRSTWEQSVGCPARSRRDMPSVGFHCSHSVSPRQCAPKQRPVGELRPERASACRIPFNGLEELMTSKLQRNKAHEILEGWGPIAAHVTRRTGVQTSPDKFSARRWAKRADDPLPVRRWACGKRPHALADVRELDRWIDQQWQAGEGKSS